MLLSPMKNGLPSLLFKEVRPVRVFKVVAPLDRPRKEERTNLGT